MIMFVLTLAGIMLSVILRDSMPDSTQLWFVIFVISLVILMIAEIRSYLHLHKALNDKQAMEQAAMADLFKSRINTKGGKPSSPADEAKLIEQMASELKARVGSSKTLTAANLQQMAQGMAAQIPHKA